MTEHGAATIASAVFSDASAFSEAVVPAAVTCSQTNKGAFQLTWTGIDLCGFGLQFMSMPAGECVALGEAAPVPHSFHVPLGLAERLTFMGERMSPNTVCHHGTRSEHWIRGSTGAALAYLVPSPAVLDLHTALFPGHELVSAKKRTHVRAATSVALERLRSLLIDVWSAASAGSEAFANDNALNSMRHQLTEALVDAVSSQSHETLGVLGRPQKCRGSILHTIWDHMRHAGPDGLQVSDLCRVTGVSQPTLHRVFQDAFDLSPKRYLQIRRLHMVRKRLLEAETPDVTVSTVAFDCGFWQYGRFCSAYKQLFGEAPSVTLRSRRRLAGV